MTQPSSSTTPAQTNNAGITPSVLDRVGGALNHFYRSDTIQSLFQSLANGFSLLSQVPAWGIKISKGTWNTGAAFWNQQHTVRKLQRQLGPDLGELVDYPIVPLVDQLLVQANKACTTFGARIGQFDERLGQTAETLAEGASPQEGEGQTRRFVRASLHEGLRGVNWVMLKLARLGNRLFKADGWVRKLGPNLRSGLILPAVGQFQRFVVGMPALDQTIANLFGSFTDRFQRLVDLNLENSLSNRQYSCRQERYKAWQSAMDKNSSWSELLPKSDVAMPFEKAVQAKAENLAQRLRCMIYPDNENANPIINQILKSAFEGLPTVNIPGFDLPNIANFAGLNGKTIDGGRVELPSLAYALERLLQQLRDNSMGAGADHWLLQGGGLLQSLFEEKFQQQTLPRPAAEHQILLDERGHVISRSKAAEDRGIHLGMAAETVRQHYAALNLADQLDFVTPLVPRRPHCEDQEIILGPDNRVRHCSDLAICLGVRVGMTRAEAEERFRENPLQELTARDYGFDENGRVCRCNLMARAYGLRPGMTEDEASKAYARSYADIHQTYLGSEPNGVLKHLDPKQAKFQVEKRPAPVFLVNPGRYLSEGGQALKANEMIIDHIQGEPIVIACSARAQEMGVFPGMQLEEARSCYERNRDLEKEAVEIRFITNSPLTAAYFTGYITLEDRLTALAPALLNAKTNELNDWVEGKLATLGSWKAFGRWDISLGNGAIHLWHFFLGALRFIAQRIYRLPNVENFSRAIAKNLISLLRSPALTLSLLEALDGVFREIEGNIARGHAQLETASGGAASSQQAAPKAQPARTIRPEAFTGDIVKAVIKIVYTVVRQPIEELGNTWAMWVTIKVAKTGFWTGRIVLAYTLKAAFHLFQPWLNENVFLPQANRMVQTTRAQQRMQGGVETELMSNLQGIVHNAESTVIIEKEVIHQALHQLAWAPSLSKALQKILTGTIEKAQERNVSVADIGRLADDDMDLAKLIHQTILFAQREVMAVPGPLREELQAAIDGAKKAKDARKLIANADVKIAALGRQNNPNMKTYLDELEPVREALKSKLERLRKKHADERAVPAYLNSYTAELTQLQRSALALNTALRRPTFKQEAKEKLTADLQRLQACVRTIRVKVSEVRAAEERIYGRCLPSTRERWKQLSSLMLSCEQMEKDPHSLLGGTDIKYDELAKLLLGVRKEIAWTETWTEQQVIQEAKYAADCAPKEAIIEAQIAKLKLICDNINKAANATQRKAHLNFLLEFFKEHKDLISLDDLSSLEEEERLLRKRIRGEQDRKTVVETGLKLVEAQVQSNRQRQMKAQVLRDISSSQNQRNHKSSHAWRFSKPLSDCDFAELWATSKQRKRFSQAVAQADVHLMRARDELFKHQRLAQQARNWDASWIFSAPGKDIWDQLLPAAHRASSKVAETLHNLRTGEEQIG